MERVRVASSLRAGPISNRRVYRWMRDCQKRGHGKIGHYSDLYFFVIAHEFCPEVEDAILDLDRYCKTLDWGIGIKDDEFAAFVYQARTRYWKGHEQWSPKMRRKNLRPGEREPAKYTEYADRAQGLRFARLFGNILRTAHKHKIKLSICAESMAPYIDPVVEQIVMDEFELFNVELEPS